MNSLDLISYAKLNLYLGVGAKRADGYHPICSLFERISLSDRIRLRLLANPGINIISSGILIPLSRNNLAYKAASLLKKKFKIKQGVEIKITKNIPVAAGLGGGSSDAAGVLQGLNKLFKLNLSIDCLRQIAGEIGSDVAFFLYKCSFASVTSRGDEIKPLTMPVKLWHVIAVPRIKIRTPLIYAKWDKMYNKYAGLTSSSLDKSLAIKQKTAGLTVHQSRVKILQSALGKRDLRQVSKLLFNSLEHASIVLHPRIEKVKLALFNLGLKAISTSGSGPTVFGLVFSRKEAHAVARQLMKLGDCDVFVAKTA